MRISWVPLLGLSLGCAGAAPPPAVAPATPSPTTAESQPKEAEPGPRVVEPAAVPPPPAECAEYTNRPTSGCAAAADAVAARKALASALEQTTPAARDSALACLESTAALPPGLVRALRAELGPEACADALVTPLVEAPPKGLSRDTESLLLGLVVSARLARLLAAPPKPEPPVTKERFRVFFADVLTPWVLSQAAAIEKLSLTGSRLAGYGRGVAAIAAGNADLRFVDMVRAVPLPDEMKADKEIENAYYGALDAALEPRKIRGRDAALVGLRAFAEVGVLRDVRIDRARDLLTKLWSGSRVNALDRVLLPDLPALDASSPELSLAARLPTFHAGEVLSDVDAGDAKMLRALLERGIPHKLRAKLEGLNLTPPARLIHARALVESGRLFFRAKDFQKAAALLSKDKLDDGGRLLLAVAKALENGPDDAAGLMVQGPFLKGTGDVSALDAEAARPSRYAGRAAFDAAYILELAPKPGDASFWDDLAARFDKAAKLLKKGPPPDPGEPATQARAYADAARATARTLKK